MAEFETDQDRPEPAPSHVPDRPGLRTFALLAGRIVLAGLLLAFCAGFVIFANAVSGPEPPPPPRAEGIVVLTGGSDRIADALALLAAGKADRLLITGVGQRTTIPEIAERYPAYRSLFRCCIDIGHEAMNTIGNAIEARQWVERHDIERTLIVVTAAYHMPRALAEMRARLPGLTLYPFAIVPERLKQDPWWRNLDAARLIGREYLKYLVVRARLALAGGKPAPLAHAPAPRVNSAER